MAVSPKHVDTTKGAQAPPSDNSYRAPFGLNISFPETVVIKMVDASALGDYEFALFFSSIFASVATGFFVAYLQSAPPQDSKVYAIVSGVFAFCFLGFFGWAFHKRRRMTARSKTFKVQAQATEEIQGSPMAEIAANGA